MQPKPIPSRDRLIFAMDVADPQAARKYLQKGKLKTTKWVVKFDILKAEQVAQARPGEQAQRHGEPTTPQVLTRAARVPSAPPGRRPPSGGRGRW